MKAKLFAIFLSVTLIAVNHAAANSLPLPSFLPDYYREAIIESSPEINFIRQSKTNGVSQYLYGSPDGKFGLSIEQVEYRQRPADALYNNLLNHVNGLIEANAGVFQTIRPDEFHAEIDLPEAKQSILAFLLPKSLLIWTYVPAAESESTPSNFENLLSFANRQRYEEAFQGGNVDMGRWHKHVFAHYQTLADRQETEASLHVLEKLIATSPFHYDAHLEYMERASDRSAARRSAEAVFRNAERQEQIEKAAAWLEIKKPTMDKISVLGADDGGLQLILIPIPPVNLWLLEDAAKVYQQITDVPVKIRRLPDEWNWKNPHRFAAQLHVESLLIEFEKEEINFTGWSKQQYLEKLSQAAESQNAYARFMVADLMAKIQEEPGQYLADPYLHHFLNEMAPYRAKDSRTMYVAITEADIYSGDSNFLFSLGIEVGNSRGSLMSYNRMLGKTLHEGFDSRQRLVERIAKELVPASLKTLQIPRSVDPTCPYSYSSGVERLDQKSLVLSSAVKEALTELRNPTD